MNLITEAQNRQARVSAIPITWHWCILGQVIPFKRYLPRPWLSCCNFTTAHSASPSTKTPRPLFSLKLSEETLVVYSGSVLHLNYLRAASCLRRGLEPLAQRVRPWRPVMPEECQIYDHSYGWRSSEGCGDKPMNCNESSSERSSGSWSGDASLSIVPLIQEGVEALWVARLFLRDMFVSIRWLGPIQPPHHLR